MENEPDVAPFIEIAAAAVAVRTPSGPAGGRSGAGAGARALRTRPMRELRDDALTSARAAIARLRRAARQHRGDRIPLKDAAELLSRRRARYAGGRSRAMRRAATAMASDCAVPHGATSSRTTRCASRSASTRSEALPRLEQVTPADDDAEACRSPRSKAIVLATIARRADQARQPHVRATTARKMMVDARRDLRQGARQHRDRRFPAPCDGYPRPARRRATSSSAAACCRIAGRDNFDAAVSARRVILKYPVERTTTTRTSSSRARNNLAYALQECVAPHATARKATSRSTRRSNCCRAGARPARTRARTRRNKNIARANLAQALGFRAERKRGPDRPGRHRPRARAFRGGRQDAGAGQGPAALGDREAVRGRVPAHGRRAHDRPARRPSRSIKASFETYQSVLRSSRAKPRRTTGRWSAPRWATPSWPPCRWCTPSDA